jgi:type IV fimbrial biogenesis protein FimT
MAQTRKPHLQGYEQAGLTLIELLVSVAILALLLTLAAPSFTSYIDRTRFTSGVDAVAASLQLARSEAYRNGQYVGIQFQGGSSWCIGSILTARPTSSSTAPCTCGSSGTCSLRNIGASTHAGISAVSVKASDGSVVSSLSYYVDPNRGRSYEPTAGATAPSTTLVLQSAGGKTAQVALSGTGVVTVCAETSGGLSTVYPTC